MTAAPSNPAQSKTAFVLSLPKTLSISEIVADAAKHGITISPKYVSNIRGEARTRAPKPPAQRRAVGRPKGSRNRSSAARVVPSARATSPAKPSTAPKMTFRRSIATLIQETLDAFAASVEQRIVKAVTEDDGSPIAPRRTAAPAAPSKRPSRVSRSPRHRAPVKTKMKPAASPKKTAPARPAPPESASYQPRILAALDAAPAGLSRSQLIRTLELKPSEEPRMGTALVALRSTRTVVLEGVRRQAVYRRVTG